MRVWQSLLLGGAVMVVEGVAEERDSLALFLSPETH